MTIETIRAHRSTSARWEDALDAQLEAYLFATSDRGRRYLNGWAQSQRDKGRPNDGFVAQGTEYVPDALFNAEPIHVSPDMQTLWEAACADFVEEPLHEQDILTAAGFVYLTRPHGIEDVHGQTIVHRAFLWSPLEVDVEGPYTKDPRFMSDAEKANPKTVTRRRGIILYMLHKTGDIDAYDNGSAYQTPTVMRRYGEGEGVRRGDLIVDGIYPWLFDDPPPKYEGSDIQGTPMTHDVQVLFRLLQQTIVTHAPGRPARPVRRRCKRYEFPERNVVIVRLRRPTTPTADDSDPRPVEWSHRWLVGGHWRNQWFPSLGVHRQVYISPYVKGPTDKPLIPRKTRIFDWSK